MATTFDRGVHLGGDDYNHATDSDYKRLRSQADQLYQKRQKLSSQSQQAYKSGDKQKAHELSEQAKKILAEAEGYNRQAAEYVFRENNADSAGDEIDLHGLYVKEAEYILQNRLVAAIGSNQTHLNVIVGKGLHSQGGIAKLKPAIDQLCDESGLRHRIDSKNTGVLIIDLQGAQLSQIPHKWTVPGNNQQQQQPQYQQQPHYQQQPQQQQQYNNNNDSNGLVGVLVKLLCSCINSK
ncbi:smr domain-containing protein [[Candida] railenensis]|uniref:Smr domain-containing protein n=1 Tax=[Candida] railenensis TaxID=45579 RepID=A0A9P0W0G8_9ASCO|nr:smr domain-containing protein [[Candida] railenensis]